MLSVFRLLLALTIFASASSYSQGLTVRQVDVSELRETVVKLPISVALNSGLALDSEFLLTHFRPAGHGPFPAVIFNHGRGTNRAATPRFRFPALAKFWTDRGFAFFALTRLGYGDTGLHPDPEESGACRQKNYAPMMAAASKQTAAAVAYAQSQDWVIKEKIVLAGQSVGGFTSVMATGLNLPGVLGAINFAGGAGGSPTDWPEQPCEYFKIGSLMAQSGAASATGAKTPMLWLYAENDRYWGASIPKKWFEAYTSAGGTAQLHQFPAIGRDGHTLVGDGTRYWHPVVDDYLTKLGLR